MSIVSSSLNSKYQEFDEYGAGSIGQRIINGTYEPNKKPPTAYEELKAWCEKYLPKDWYEETETSQGNGLWFGDTLIKFNIDGSVSFIDQREQSL